MELLEANPLPKECENCLALNEDDCGECEVSRWEVSREDELFALRTLKIKAVQRLLKELESIDKELGEILENKKGI